MAANELERIPALIRHAMKVLDGAVSAAEILDAKKLADAAYSTAKLASRLRGAKDAHDVVLQSARRCMGDALQIEARAQTRLADEYDRAQECGEVRQHGRNSRKLADGKPPTVAQLGLSHGRIHEARAVRDAEKAQPGCVKKAVEAALEAAKTPTKEAVKRAISAVSGSKISNRHRGTSSKRSVEVEAAPVAADDDIGRVLELAERVRSKYGDASADVRALCDWVATHLRVGDTAPRRREAPAAVEHVAGAAA